MKTILETVIDDIKQLRGKKVSIFSQPVTLKNELDILEIDVIDVLENLKEYEIDINDIDMNEYIESDCGNSYNWLSPVSNHINYVIYKNDEHNSNTIVECRVHRYGDVRSNYTNYFYLSFIDPIEFYEVLSECDIFKSIEIDDQTYYIDIKILSEAIEVSHIDGGYIGIVSACDLNDLKNEIRNLVN